MASRKEQKEEARARRLAEEQAAAQRAQRNRRFQMLAGVLVGAAIVIVAAIVISSNNKTVSTSANPNGTQQQQIVKQVDALLSGIPQTGTTLGNPSAPVTMTYYGDLECPICRDFTLIGGFPQLVQNEVRQGKVKVVYKSFCTATCNGPGQGPYCGGANFAPGDYYNTAELTAVTPEPASWMSLAGGLAGLGVFAARRRKA